MSSDPLKGILDAINPPEPFTYTYVDPRLDIASRVAAAIHHSTDLAVRDRTHEFLAAVADIATLQADELIKRLEK